MNRSSLDRLISSTGLIIGVVMLVASGVLWYAHDFIHTEVHDQLSEQRISFPTAGPAIASLPATDQVELNKYAGQQLLTGAQAKVFADNYIAVHLEESTGGKTYSELSDAARADPTNAKIAGQVQVAFKGETLRGLLLNAYAFDTMALVALYVAYGALVTGALLIGLAYLGYYHAGTVTVRKVSARGKKK